MQIKKYKITIVREYEYEVLVLKKLQLFYVLDTQVSIKFLICKKRKNAIKLEGNMAKINTWASFCTLRALMMQRGPSSCKLHLIQMSNLKQH